MEKLIGKLKHMKNVRILSIYSKNLAKQIKKGKNQVSIKDFKDGINIRPNGKIHATIAKEKRIQISITNLIKKGIIDSNKTKKTELPVYIDPAEWNLKDILQKSIGLPITKEIPRNLISKRAAITRKNKQYYIDISLKKLYELTKLYGFRCLLKKDYKDIIIVKSNSLNSRKITAHSKKRIQISIPRKMLNNKEIKALSKSSWLPINIKFNIESFKIKIEDFYSIKEEYELVKYLVRKNLKIKIKDYKDPYDIFIINSNSGIETHNSIPYPNDLSTRHRIKPGQVRLRILEADFLVRHKKVNSFFVILNEKWRDTKYIKELTDSLSKQVFVVFTDFQGDWYKKIGNKIIELIKGSHQ